MDYQATEKLKLNAGITYNKAQEDWEWGTFTERSPLLAEGGAQVNTPLTASTQAPGPYAGVDFDTWEQNNNIDSYSDLSYEQYQLTLGGTYNFTDNCYTTASVTYEVFNSDQKYVYGDEDGNALSGYLGFGYRF